MKCVSCGAVIPKERLEILPDSKVCVKCAQKSVVRKSVEVLESSTSCRNGFGNSD